MGIFKKKELKIGLALGSGAARGLAHIGVFYISDSSMDALLEACFLI